MITISDESIPAMLSVADPGSDNTPARATSSGDSLPAPVSSTESTPITTPVADSVAAGVTSPGDRLPAPRPNTEPTHSMMSGDNPGSGEIASGVASSASHSNAESTAIPPDQEQAMVVYGKAKSEEEDPNEASGSYSDYLTWTNRKLRQILKEVKREATGKFLDALSKLIGKTKVILVVGQTGTGKTSLLQSLTGSADLKPAGTMSSGTRHYEIHTAILNEEQFLFVDTAGFGAADLEDKGNLGDIEACLTALGPFTTIVGVFFVYGCPERLFENDKKTIQWLQCFCGPEFYRNITIVTTKWDNFNDEGFVERWAKIGELKGVLSSILDPGGRREGGILYHHGLQDGQGPSDASIAYSRVLKRVSHAEERAQSLRTHFEKHYCNTSPEQIQFLKELQEGKKRMETEAGKALTYSVFENEVVIRGDRAVVVAKTQPAQDDKGDKATSAPSQENPKPKPKPTEGQSDEKVDDKGDKATSAPSQENPKPKPKPTEGQSDEKVKVPQKASSPKSKGDTTSPDSEPEPSFAEKVGKWLALLYEVTRGFREATSRSTMGARPSMSPVSSPTWGSWLFGWFSGPPKDGQN